MTHPDDSETGCQDDEVDRAELTVLRESDDLAGGSSFDGMNEA